MVYRCKYCNKEFIPTPYQKRQLNKGKDIFCSKSCGTASRYNKVKVVDEQLINKIKYFMAETDLSYTEIQKQCNMNTELFQSTLKQYNLGRSKEHINQLKIKKMQQTVKERYNVDNAMELQKFRDNVSKGHNNRTEEQKQLSTEKRQKTKLQKYGDKNYNNYEKSRQTMLEKYGYDCGFKSEISIHNRQQTSLNKYGVDNPFKSEDVRNKGKIIIQQKYGVVKSSLQSPVVREKAKQTLIQKYGVDNIMKSDKYKKKLQNTLYSKYNVISGFLTENGVNSHKQGTKSKINNKFVEMLKDITTKPIKQEKSIIKYIYDIQIGEDLLIDINPTVTHNTFISYPFRIGVVDKNKPVNKNYHLDRTLLANEHNFKLISIFDWDNWDKILYLIQDKETLYARNLTIKEVDKDTCNVFLNDYHIQNTCRGQEIRLGLYKNKQLIQIMTFGKPRYNKNYEYELLRLCTHKDYKVVGGAEKLFKHFVKTYKPKSIISYCDYSKFSGEVYQRLGFVTLNKPVPSKHWSKEDVQITDNLLRQRGYDQLFKANYGKGTDNEELMLKNGWLPIYDCGQLTFSWKEDIDNETNS